MICKLGTLASVKGGKRLPKGINLISAPNSHPYIRVRDLNNQRTLELNSNYEFVDNETQKQIARYIVQKGDIILSIVGTIGLVAIVGESLDKANLTENCVKIVVSEKIDSKFLYYYLKSPIGQAEITKRTVGAVQAKLPIKNIQDIDVWLPHKDTQAKIASVLSCIDDKIELNKMINENLLEQADLFYEHIFSNERYFNELGNVIKTTSGGTPSRKHTELYENPSICWVKSKELNGSFIHTTEEMINKLALSKSAAKMLPAHSVLVAMYGATVGEYGIIASPMTCNQAVCALLPNDRYPYPYLYELIRHSNDILKNMAVGSAQQNISQVLIKQLPVHTNIDKVEQFTDATRASFQMIETLTLEIIHLAFIRDTMLPKLMSGEIKMRM